MRLQSFELRDDPTAVPRNVAASSLSLYSSIVTLYFLVDPSFHDTSSSTSLVWTSPLRSRMLGSSPAPRENVVVCSS